MTPMPATLWAHKAHALLIPTPLADRDPAGEPGRLAELRDILGDLAIADTPEIAELHHLAQRDARTAHHDDTGVVTHKPQHLGLRHPLSGALLEGRSRLDPASWPEFTAYLRRILEEHSTAGPRERYIALWRALMKPDAPLGLASLPGDPIFNDHPRIAHRSAAAALVGARLEGHEAALLHLHIGPVQGFIAAARRTQDLWLGSYIVAYLSMQAVYAIAEQLGPDAVLYPDLSTLPLYGALADRDRPDPDRSGWLRASLPNRFMALVPSHRAEDLARRAADRVASTWRSIGARVQENLPRGDIAGDKSFQCQLAAHLEIDATLQPWGSDASYKWTFQCVRDDLTAQRRLITDFPPVGSAVAKCTQCGEREQLGGDMRSWRDLRNALDLRYSDGQQTGARRETIDLRDGEALCAVCLTKRFANRWYFGAVNGGSVLELNWEKADTDRLLLRFPSVATIASAPARAALARSAADTSAWEGALARCHAHLRFTEPGNLLQALGGPARARSMVLDVDGTWFYDTSYIVETALRDHELAKTGSELEQTRTELRADLPEALGAFKACLGQVAKGYNRSSLHITPYYAVISLDVDKMGKWLDGSHDDALNHSDFLATLEPATKRSITPALHREISRRQSSLASGPLYAIVEQHLGRVIYSGGDDLLAFVPLPTLWHCLADLHQRFRANDALGDKVTVSAGVAVTHWRAPLSQALHLAREAEKTAKEREGDKVVIQVDKRSGAPLTYIDGWDAVALLPSTLARILAATDDPAREANIGASPGQPRPIALSSLDDLEHELDSLDECPTEAVRARVFLHLTGSRITDLEIMQDPLIRHIHRRCEPRERPALLNFLHLLRFLAREHDPVIAAVLSRHR